jgi:replication-associated recombination protein RarA
MHYLQRSPWQGLQPHQSAELDTAILQPHRRGLRRSEAFQSIADEYAKRCALLLVSNDLRGAMNAAEISAAAEAMARKVEADDMRAAERLAQFEQTNPEDPAVAFLPPKPGARRRTRKPTTGV